MIRSVLLVVLVAVLCVAPAVAGDGEQEIERQVYIFSSGGSWLGVSVGDVDEDRAAELGLDEAVGAEIQSVVPDSPAAEAFRGNGEKTEYECNRGWCEEGKCGADVLAMGSLSVSIGHSHDREQNQRNRKDVRSEQCLL